MTSRQQAMLITSSRKYFFRNKYLFRHFYKHKEGWRRAPRQHFPWDPWLESVNCRDHKEPFPRSLVTDVLSSTAQAAPHSRTWALWGTFLHRWAIFLCLPEKTTPLPQSSPQRLSQPAICLELMQPCHSCQRWDYKCTWHPVTPNPVIYWTLFITLHK